MNLVFIQTEGGVGGAEMCLLDVVATVRTARPDWKITVVLGDHGPIEAAIDELGASRIVEPAPRSLAQLGDAGLKGKARTALLLGRSVVAGAAIARHAARLRRTIGRLKPDLVQSNGMKAHVLAAIAVPKSVPLVWHMHDYISSRPLMCKILRVVIAMRRGGSITVVGVSRSVAADAERAFAGRRGVSVQTIYNAVDVDRFRPGTAEESASAGVALDRAAGFGPAGEGTVRVGLIATFAIWKGHDVFLEAAARLVFSGPIRLYIIGGPIYRSTGSQQTVEALRRRIDELGLRDRVGLTGHIAEPADAIRGVDVVVHASVRPEPFGRVIVEGMACGKAVIVSVPSDDWRAIGSEREGVLEPKVSTSGASELFEHEVSAVGVPAGDPDALAAAIARLADNRELRIRLGDEGRNAAIERFDRSELAEHWVPMYVGRKSSVP